MTSILGNKIFVCALVLVKYVYKSSITSFMYANIGFLQLIENVSNLIYEITNGGATDSYFCSFSTLFLYIQMPILINYKSFLLRRNFLVILKRLRIIKERVVFIVELIFQMVIAT